MSIDPLRRAIAMLVAAFPWTNVDPLTPEVYVRSLADLPADEVDLAVRSLIDRGRRMPSVAEVRDLVFERRLELPTPVEAWESVQRIIRTPARRDHCPTCGGDGFTDPDRDDLCPACGGAGDVEVARTPLLRALPIPVRRALDTVGGSVAIAEAEKPEVLRGQFDRAYLALRRVAVDEESLASAGLPALTRREIPALEAGPS